MWTQGPAPGFLQPFYQHELRTEGSPITSARGLTWVVVKHCFCHPRLSTTKLAFFALVGITLQQLCPAKNGDLKCTVKENEALILWLQDPCLYPIIPRTRALLSLKNTFQLFLPQLLQWFGKFLVVSKCILSQHYQVLVFNEKIVSIWVLVLQLTVMWLLLLLHWGWHIRLH